MNAITNEETSLLRELAKQQQEYANLPVMEQRKQLWYAHNSLHSVRPMIIVEELSFEKDLLPPLQCTTPLARELELGIRRHCMNHVCTDDDKVIPDTYALPMVIPQREFDFDFAMVKPEGEDGDSIAHHYEHLIEDLETDLSKLRHSVYHYNAAENTARLQAAQEAIGDILPVALVNNTLEWYPLPTFKAVRIMDHENLLCEMAMNPELVAELLRLITDDILAYCAWLETNRLLTMNNANHYIGSGSLGFTHELCAPADGAVTTHHLWGNINSQESSTISPAMYGELVYPYCKQLAEAFGMVYYGCCEPVHAIWDPYLQHLPHLRKISVSAWCDEVFMGQALKDSRVIYSRKPNPIFLGVGKQLDEPAFRAHIQATLDAAKGCNLEFIFRDVYTLTGNLEKPRRAVQIIREMSENW